MLTRSSDAVADTVALFLSEHGTPPHRPFWWREWEKDAGNGQIRKKVSTSHVCLTFGSDPPHVQGMFQQSVILYTLGMAHFVEYSSVEEIPDPLNMKKDEKPVGALILALQAVRVCAIVAQWSDNSAYCF